MTGTRSDLIRTLVVSSLALYFGFGLWFALFNNFAVEVVGIRADQMGLVQSLREIPGLLGFWLVFLAVVMTAVQVLSISTIVMGIGLIALGMAQTWAQMIFGVMLTSIGFHAFYPNSQAVALLITEEHETPHLLAYIQRLAAVGSVAATLFVVLLLDRIGYRNVFYITGGLTMLGGVLSWARNQPKRVTQEKGRIILRRRYWLYYALTFLMGSRRHIFTTFAIFLLVKEMGMSAQYTAIMLLINNILGILLYKRLGSIVARFGERPVLAANFIILTFIFVGYAVVRSLPVLLVFFVVDNFLFGTSFAVESYFKKIAISPDDIMSSVSLSQTINHIAAVVLPLAGGIAWELVDPSVPFLGGVVITVVSLALLWYMRTQPVAAPVPAATVTS